MWPTRPLRGVTVNDMDNPALVPASCSAVGMCVLLVDDDGISRDVIGTFLRHGGHTVVMAENGQQAVDIASGHAFDLILMDLRMPGIGGLEAARRIRALSGPCGQVPILALTGSTTERHLAQCADAGMNGHVAKPVDQAALMLAVSGITLPTAAADPGHQPVRLDRAVLEQTVVFLPPDEVGGYLQSLRTRAGEMLVLLDRQDAWTEKAEAAHALASVAGTFGFAALSAASRSFERAAEDGLPDACATGLRMRAEACAAMDELDGLLLEALG